ncbi:serine/threonine-protein phosphatase 4 regulatory subunit 2 isoform X2 [Scaptodrosophila lebanonensis]|uniref:Serine/threonine-protein phosphatase 4 regulatory subunit 2 isoform X2 n=1 Tax=Drosophila lebanonensis TaxID=7225 RepID=A0A6J2U2X4_DROLE|nr:serine/threonine-protein phosphatase 4 regulatory subunit 2 isoform X2 [Scaptodrosophila lebanonensis]
MVTMENSEEILQILERFTRLKQKEIPKELEDYLQYVAKTGDTIFKWSSLKYLFREKLLHVIKHFNEDSPRLEDPFNYETMKSSLLERLDLFNAAPFTVQRLCELLIDPRKQYSRIDKFMRALEKNILVVSTIEPGRKRTESENGDSLDSVVNGDLSLEVNIDIEMENEGLFNNMDERNGNAEESSSGTLKASCPRSDDTVQPKAKKVKLDYDEEERPEAASSSNNTDDVESEATGSLPVETALKTKPDVESIDAEVDATDGTGVVREKKARVDAQQQTAEAVAEAEEAENEDESKKISSADKQAKDAKEVKVAPVEEELPESKPVAAKVDAATKDDESDEQDGTAERAKEETPAEKVKTPTADSEAKASDSEAVAKSEKAIKEKETETVEKKEPKISEKTDTPAEPAKPEKEADTEEPKPSSQAKKPEEIAQSPEKEAEEEKTADKEAAEEAPAKATTQTEPESKSDAGTANATGDGAGDTNTEKTETESTAKSKATAVPAEDEDVKKKDEKKSTDPEVAVADKEAPSLPVPIETDEPAAEAVAAAQPAASTASTATPPTTVAPPALTLNDQPMEDTPAEEEEEQSQISPSAAVEEVVMAETGAATGGEMATDDAPKDEPAAMEVDDTSQEVMDQ